MMSKVWRFSVAVLVLILIGMFLTRFIAVDTRPLPQAQPTLDVQRPTQPVRELAPTPTATTVP